MLYETIPPPPHLAHVIRFFWVLEGEAGYTHHNMADAGVELIFHIRGQFDEIAPDGRTSLSFTSGVHGVSHTLRKYIIDTGFRIFGVYFYPQAIPLLFSLPAEGLANEAVELPYLLKDAGRILEEKIMEAKNNRERCELICRFAEERLSASRQMELPVFAAIRDIIHRTSSASIQSLSREYYLSERQFERQFKQYAGLSPKLFSRIVRFQSATALYHHRGMSLGSLALECGYYDQSHFISDFKTFSGMHPKQYFSGRSGATDWRD